MNISNLYLSLHGYGMYFDVATAVASAVSAALWLASSRVKITPGYDMDQIVKDQWDRASTLNARAACAAAVVALIVCAKAFLVGS
jgi:hypothetical protein